MKKKNRKSRISPDDRLRALVVHAAQDGVAGAIEHCNNFWRTGDGFKKYIDHQIEERAQALLATVKVALRAELATYKFRRRKLKRDR